MTTRLSLLAGILDSMAILASGIQSFFEDQRSLNPSDLLVLYYSASTILSLPLLRSLYLMPYGVYPKGIWTANLIVNVAIVFLESVPKSKLLRPKYKNTTAEQITGFWGRSIFVWVLPLFQYGHSKILQLDDIAHIDDALREKYTSFRLDILWGQMSGRYRLLRAAILANIWPFLSAILPRLALSAFNICQPFLVQSAVSYVSTQTEKNDQDYGKALIGAFALVYVGIAVSNHSICLVSVRRY